MAPRVTPRDVGKFVGDPAGWIIQTSYRVSPQIELNLDDLCKIRGEQGLFKFKRHVINTNVTPPSEWIDLFGGTTGTNQWRSIKPERLQHIPKKRGRKKSGSG